MKKRMMLTLDGEALDALERLKQGLHSDNASYVVRLALIHEVERLYRDTLRHVAKWDLERLPTAEKPPSR